MNTKKLIKKLKLNDQTLEKIKTAVQKAESSTQGEIAVAVASESDHYSFWELLYSNIVSLLVMALLLPFSSKVTDIINLIYWNSAPVWILPAFYVCTTIFLIAVLFYLTNIPFLDRIVIPLSVKTKNVTNRAVRYFCESGVYKTSTHCGILIYISYMERQVRIIADSGINERISQDLWNLIADELTENLSKGRFEEGILCAIEKCSELLTQQFPLQEQKANELSDGLAIVEV